MAIACEFVDKKKQTDADLSEKSVKTFQDSSTTPPPPATVTPDAPTEPPKKPEEAPSQPSKPVTQWDSKALDAQVESEAKKQGKDPKTFRMPVNNENGTKTYRMLGMYVIVDDSGEEVFLPDEL